MNDQDIIRKAVELADGFVLRKEGEGFVHYYGPSEYEFIGTHFGEGSDQFLYDALAAQLVRQVESAGYWISIYGVIVSIEPQPGDTRGEEFEYIGNLGDRTMNTLRAIVESGVLASTGEKDND